MKKISLLTSSLLVGTVLASCSSAEAPQAQLTYKCDKNFSCDFDASKSEGGYKNPIVQYIYEFDGDTKNQVKVSAQKHEKETGLLGETEADAQDSNTVEDTHFDFPMMLGATADASQVKHTVKMTAIAKDGKRSIVKEDLTVNDDALVGAAANKLTAISWDTSNIQKGPRRADLTGSITGTFRVDVYKNKPLVIDTHSVTSVHDIKKIKDNDNGTSTYEFKLETQQRALDRLDGNDFTIDDVLYTYDVPAKFFSPQALQQNGIYINTRLNGFFWKIAINYDSDYSKGITRFDNFKIENFKSVGGYHYEQVPKLDGGFSTATFISAGNSKGAYDNGDNQYFTVTFDVWNTYGVKQRVGYNIKIGVHKNTFGSKPNSLEYQYNDLQVNQLPIWIGEPTYD